MQVTSLPAASFPRIADYDDAAFDPFATYDRAVGLWEVEDPYPKFHELHAAGAVQKGDIRRVFGLSPFSFWADYPSYMVFGYEHASRVLLDGRHLSNELSRAMYEGTFGDSINAMDGAEHVRYRTLFQQAFLPKPLQQWGIEVVPRVISDIIARFKRRGYADLVGEFTLSYPFEVLYAQLGLPEEDLGIFRRLSAGLMCTFIDYPHAHDASLKMGDYFKRLLDERRGGAGTDFISALANAEVNGERLPDEITISFLRQLMNAAGDTTYRSTGSLLVGLLQNPEQLDALKRDRSLIPQAVEEGLRWEGPLPTLIRMTTSDLPLGDVVVPRHAKVDIIVGSANRDPARYAQPDQFDIFRKPSRHLSFALGVHICLGQHLVRVEMARALEGLLDELPNLRLDPQKPPPRVVGLHARTPAQLHVLFDPP